MEGDLLMAYTSKQRIIVYVDRAGISFFDSQTQQLSRFNFLPIFYHDLEIVNIEEFQKQLSQFIQTNKLQPSFVSLVLSTDFIFDTTIPHDGKTVFETEKDKFIDTVPFEQVSVKIIPGEKEDIIISTNKLLYVMITHTLELNSFQVKEVLPSTLLIKDIPTLSQGFNASVAKSIVSMHDKYKTYDLHEHTGIESAQNANTQSKSRFKTIHILIVVFVLLICLLAYLILRPQDSVLTPNTTVPVVSPQVIPTVLVSPTEAVKVSTESATVNIATLKVQLNGASTTGGQIEDIKKNLTAIGISNIETKSDAQVTSSKTLVILKQGMSQDFKDKIIGELRKTNQDISTQETQESSYDVIVNLATL